MSELDRLRAWTYHRLRIGTPAITAEQALRSVVGVYATHPTAPLALWARARSFTAARYRRLDRDGKGVRIPAMRRTVFLVPGAHASRIFAATRATPAHARRSLKRVGISPQRYGRLATRNVEAADAPVTTRELERVIDLKGQELATVLRALRYEGRILTLAGESLNMSPHRYVATDSWLDEELEGEDATSALQWLAGEYLRAYGPARVEDFKWWTGATKSAARAAIEVHETIEVGDGALLLTKDEAAFDKTKAVRNAVALLPRWDAYTMGYAPDGRHRFVNPDVQSRVYTPIGVGLPGDGNPVVLVNGEALATWTYNNKDGPSVQPFESLGSTTRRRVDASLDEIGGLLAG